VDDVDLALRERQFDAVVAKALPQRQIDLALDVGDAADGIVDPEPQHQIDRAVAEPGDVADRRRVVDHAGDDPRQAQG
jgi:hypothetical protein